MLVPDATFISAATERNWPPLTWLRVTTPENSGGTERVLDAAHASNNRVIKP